MGFLASATAAVSLSVPLQAWLESLGIAGVSQMAAGISVFLVTLAISYFTLVVGELVPKRLGLQKAEKVAIFSARPIRFLSTVLAPLVYLLTRSTKLVAKLVGAGDDKSAEGISEEELKLIVTEQGQLLEEEKRMIHAVFGLNDTQVREIMVPRVDIFFIEDNITIAEAIKEIQARGFSRVPVFQETRDRIVGILFVKDLLIPLAEGKGDKLVSDYMREPFFVPETKIALELLEEMQASRQQLAVVVDEYGGTDGIVTLEDIVEEIVGEIFDEFDRGREAVREQSEGIWIVEGSLSIDDALEYGFEIEGSEDYETLAGWMLDQMGHIPYVGEKIEHNGYIFSVQNMRRRRIARIRIDGRQRGLHATGDSEQKD